MKIGTVRRFALSLTGVNEEPHFNRSSFRVKGKIFATVSPDEDTINIFLPEEERETALALFPEFCEKQWWGKKVTGITVTLSRARAAEVKGLLKSAWRSKSPPALVK